MGFFLEKIVHSLFFEEKIIKERKDLKIVKNIEGICLLKLNKSTNI